MSDHDTPRDTHVVKASSGGGGWKWLAGGVAAAVLLGGGYYAYKSMAPATETQTAYNDTSSTEPSSDSTRAGPLPPDQSTTEAQPYQDETPAPVATPERRASTSAPARQRQRQVARAEVVPETVVGITPVSAQEEDIIVQGRRQPVWTRTPSARRLTTAYPERAAEHGLEGEARLSCTVLVDGKLDCVRISETRGFGMAAMRVSRMFRHAPERADGSSAVGSPVNLRVVFRMDEQNRRG